MPHRLNDAHIAPGKSEVLEKTSAIQEMRISTVGLRGACSNRQSISKQEGCIELDT